ncbi:uncharacterized protein Z519_10858 [Cladophialophora bantiana CBS 173.52]|uniref:DUF6590 domain-containing protein n=1 Tax=Cladophialophora bantiana (strain ATCC 10958 / CBS 173.52 / CDC B-1940 / NIH 8579) TaxID=1442370 RepID=A0A0D2EDS8_CLAB1|nr:uncharacterized protein Z519_10858 [Cladophialophora bantiana CBS 173.52]KIW88291.1 hypothetical protein Z519_10858 [Cladophialophora bantiana CBS 173.52]
MSQSTPETSTVVAASRPSAAGVEFIRIEYNDFPGCSRFIDRDPSILSADLQSFLDAAVQAVRNHDRILSLRCIQRYVIIKKCRNLTAEDRHNYLSLLGRKDPNEPTWHEYCSDREKTSGEVHRRFQESLRALQQNDMDPPGSQSRCLNEADTRSYGQLLPAGWDISYRRPVVSHAGHFPYPSASAYTQSVAYPTVAQRRELSSIDSIHQTSASGIPTKAEAATGQDVHSAPSALSASRTSVNYQRDTRGSDQQQDATKSRAYLRSSHSYDAYDYRHKPPTAGGLENVEFRGNNKDQLAADSERLDPRYILRSDGATFFCEGRVFSLMHHEPLGLRRGDPPVRGFDKRSVSEGPKGVLIYSKIRRMAVVRKRQGYSICVPINSYGGRGVGQKKMGSEMQAHAIAYPSYQDPPPGPLPEEPQFKKRPIAVDLNQGHDLEAGSRIHFGKLQSIEWNVKVMDIGFIAPKSLNDFEAYWREEYFPSEGPRVDNNTRR